MSELEVHPGAMASAVAELKSYPEKFASFNRRRPCTMPLPSRKEVNDILEGLREILFPGYLSGHLPENDLRQNRSERALDNTVRELEKQIRRALCFGCSAEEEIAGCSWRAADIARKLIGEFPAIQQTLFSDVTAAYEGDPACKSPEEAILTYPGIYALTLFRIAHALSDLEVPLLPRMITEIAHSATGIDIHPGAQIGRQFFIDHGTGVVIGETCIIGERVRLYQGVTLGARSFALDEEGKPVKGVPRHPVVEDDVIIYAGATILGRITIGKGSVIGGNVWLTRSVPPGSQISQASSR